MQGQFAAVSFLLLAATANWQMVRESDPTETTIGTGGASASALDGAWQVGTGASAISFRIDGRVMAGRTPCGPFSAMLPSGPGRVGAVILSMPQDCPRRYRRDQLVFRANLEAVASFSVVSGSLVARDQAGSVLFTAARVDSTTVPVGAVHRLDGTWAASQARQPGGTTSPAPVLRIRGAQLFISGACNEYAGTLTTGAVVMGAHEARILVTSATQRLCVQQGAEQADAALLRTLETVRWVRVTGNRLELLVAPQRIALTFFRQ